MSSTLGALAVSCGTGTGGDRGRVGSAAHRSGARPARPGVHGGGAFGHRDDCLRSGGVSRRAPHLEHNCRLSDTLPPPTTTLRGGLVPGVTPCVWLARVLWALGYADRARRRCQEALLLARQGDHLPNLAYAECFNGAVGRIGLIPHTLLTWPADESFLTLPTEILPEQESRIPFAYARGGNTNKATRRRDRDDHLCRS
jgi:hypothetical protein